MKDSVPINHEGNRLQALSEKDQQIIEANNFEETFPPPSNEVPSRASRRRSTRAPGKTALTKVQFGDPHCGCGDKDCEDLYNPKLEELLEHVN